MYIWMKVKVETTTNETECKSENVKKPSWVRASRDWGVYLGETFDCCPSSEAGGQRPFEVNRDHKTTHTHCQTHRQGKRRDI